MTNGFDPTKHPRNDNDGKFTEKRQTDPGDCLLPAADATLTEALGRYGLTTDDVPGLEQVWAEQFSILDKQPPASIEDVGEDLLGYPNFGRHRGGPWLEVADDTSDTGWRLYEAGDQIAPDTELALLVHTRNGGGNREHDCDDGDQSGCLGCVNDTLQNHPLYLNDEDDEGDQTYANFWFRVPAHNRDEVVRAANSARYVREWNNANWRRQQILDGQMPPWSLLADDDELRAHQEQVRAVRSSLIGSWQRERTTAAITASERYLAAANGAEVGPIDWNDSLTIGEGFTRRVVFLNEVVKWRDEAAQASAEHAKFNRIRAEIDAGGLSADLRDYLVGERPEQSYRTTEGTGRNKRTVVRTFRPEPDFVERAAEAASDHQRVEAKLAETRQLVGGHLEGLRSELERDNEANRRLAQLADEEWALGWPGDLGLVPERQPHPGATSEEVSLDA